MLSPKVPPKIAFQHKKEFPHIKVVIVEVRIMGQEV